MMVLDDGMSKKEGSAQGGESLVEAQQQTETDAVESGVTWKAVSGPEAPMWRWVAPACLRLGSAGRARDQGVWCSGNQNNIRGKPW